MSSGNLCIAFRFGFAPLSISQVGGERHRASSRAAPPAPGLNRRTPLSVTVAFGLVAS
jgi:hypothetical protein